MREDVRTELDAGALDQLFRAAHTHSAWLDRPVTDDQLRRIYDLMKWGPTSANSSPARLLFLRNGSLQGAYLILAARAIGLDAGPMSGFDNEKVDREFFPDRQLRSNFLVILGYGDRSRLHARNPRLSFEEAARVL